MSGIIIGTPKGAMFMDTQLCMDWKTALVPLLFEKMSLITLVYMPQNHVMGRQTLQRTLATGGLTYFLRAFDYSTLIEDIAICRPTKMTLVPRVASLIYEHFQMQLKKRIEGLVLTEGERAKIDREVRADFRSSLFPRLIFCLIASASTPKVVWEFLEDCAGAVCVDGYGTTEAGYIALDGR